jgi:hypothetical protein
VALPPQDPPVIRRTALVSGQPRQGVRPATDCTGKIPCPPTMPHNPMWCCNPGENCGLMFNQCVPDPTAVPLAALSGYVAWDLGGVVPGP